MEQINGIYSNHYLTKSDFLYSCDGYLKYKMCDTQYLSHSISTPKYSTYYLSLVNNIMSLPTKPEICAILDSSISFTYHHIQSTSLQILPLKKKSVYQFTMHSNYI